MSWVNVQAVLTETGVPAGYELGQLRSGLRSQHGPPGETKRVFEAIYAKVLVADDALSVPDEDALTMKTAMVWEALFGPLNKRDEGGTSTSKGPANLIP